MSGLSRGKLLFLSLTAAMGGFLFGYDTAVINGAEQQIQAGWNLTAAVHGWVMSAALWGTVVGAFFGGRLTDWLGRKPTLFWVGVFYLVSAAWSGLATGAWTLMVARFIGGLAVGVSSIAAPCYIAEISPSASRGRLTALFQLLIIIGMCVSQFVNWALGNVGATAWRWMLGAEAVPALVFTLLTPFLVESPRYLMMKAAGTTTEREATFAEFFIRANLRPILLVFLLAFFNQWSGINVVLYFAPRIFSMAGFGGQDALAITAVMGIVNAVSTMAGVLMIDRFGRKTLLLIGGIGYVISLFSCSAAFVFDAGFLASLMVLLFVASHMVGQGAVIWVYLPEVFPTRYRAKGQSFGSFTHWFNAAMITLFFPMVAARVSPSLIFGFFGFMMVLQLVWIVCVVPETRGRNLDEIKM